MKHALIAGLTCAALSAGSLAAQDCTPSKWGAEDELGSANHVTAENTLKAAALGPVEIQDSHFH